MNDTFPRFGIQRKNIEKEVMTSDFVNSWSHQTSQTQTFLTSILLFKKSLKRFLNNKDNVSSLSLLVSVSVSLSLFSFCSFLSLHPHTRTEKKRKRGDTTTQHNTTHTIPTIQERTENQTKVKFDDSDLTRFLVFFFDNFYVTHFHVICMTLFSVSHLDFHFPFLLFFIFFYFIYLILPHPSHLWTIILFFNIR